MNAIDTASDEIRQQTGMEPAEFLRAFTPLGCDCELGMVQRRFGAEPLSLLRFASIGIEDVTRGIKAGFAGIADDVEMFLSEPASRQWDLRARRYNMVAHTFQDHEKHPAETAAPQHAERLRYLAAELMAEIAERDSIFVVWSVDRDITETQLAALRRALGTKRLVHVVQGDEAGRVSPSLAGVLRVTIDSFATPAMRQPDGFGYSALGWCRALLAAWKRLNCPEQRALPTHGDVGRLEGVAIELAMAKKLLARRRISAQTHAMIRAAEHALRGAISALGQEVVRSNPLDAA